MKTKKKSQDRIAYDRLAIVLAIGALLFYGMLIFTEFRLKALENKLNHLPPENLGAVYYDGNGNAWIRFDLHDAKQQVIVNSIKAICLQENLVNCQSSMDRLNIRR